MREPTEVLWQKARIVIIKQVMVYCNCSYEQAEIYFIGHG